MWFHLISHFLILSRKPIGTESAGLVLILMTSDQCIHTLVYNTILPFYAFISHILTFVRFPVRFVMAGEWHLCKYPDTYGLIYQLLNGQNNPSHTFNFTTDCSLWQLHHSSNANFTMVGSKMAMISDTSMALSRTFATERVAHPTDGTRRTRTFFHTPPLNTQTASTPDKSLSNACHY